MEKTLDPNRMLELPGLGGTQTATLFIDDKDRVSGWALPAQRGHRRRPYLWTMETGTQDIRTLVGFSGVDCAYGILDDGQVLGSSSGHIFLWSPESGYREFELPPGCKSAYPIAANDLGEVLCSVSTGSRKIGPSSFAILCSPFLWTEAGGFKALPVPPGFDDVRPVGFDANGVVLLHAGKLPDRTPEAYLLKNGEIEHLPIPVGWSSARYLNINALGWLVGIVERTRRGKTERRGFILKPR